MRRVDLAEQVFLTASGMTRLLDGLEKAGYVERAACDADRRVVYAVLTPDGESKFRAASASHFAQIDALFESRLDGDDLVRLSELLGRLGDACSPSREDA